MDILILPFLPFLPLIGIFSVFIFALGLCVSATLIRRVFS